MDLRSTPASVVLYDEVFLFYATFFTIYKLIITQYMKCMIHGTVQVYNTWSIQHNTSSAPRQLFENCLKDNFQFIKYAWDSNRI